MVLNKNSTGLILLDIIIVALIPYCALFIRFEGAIGFGFYQAWLYSIPAIVLLRIGTFYALGLYQRLWRYASINELLAIIGSVTISSIIFAVYTYAIEVNLPRSIHFLSWFMTIALIGISRLFVRIRHHLNLKHSPFCSRVLIIGAGDSGAIIAQEINRRYYATKELVGFIDDDRAKRNQWLFGAKVLGSRQDLTQVVADYEVQETIIAISPSDPAILREIICDCKQIKCAVKILPSIHELIDEKVTIQSLREVDVADLLRRDPVKLDLVQIGSFLTNKTVLVTGAGGSIGSELSRQIAKMSPKALFLLGKGENSIYEIDRELRAKHPGLNIIPVIADIRDEDRVFHLFHQLKPQVVFHAAAHKHVPLMERQPVEAVKNNVFGTKIVAQAAHQVGTETFVMISSDKAVNPTSVMGTTKKVAELIVQSMSQCSSTKYVVVRFGNVLGSRGSVVPLFKQQIAKGGPITITDPEMERYFMTISEASQLVLQAGAMAKGGEVFVLDMGEPIKILDMACDLIRLSGLVPYRDIEFKFTGLRSGEKLFEELLTAEEGSTATRHHKIFAANLKTIDEKRLQQKLVVLQHAKIHDEIINALCYIVPSYKATMLQHCVPSTTVQKNKSVVATNASNCFIEDSVALSRF